MLREIDRALDRINENKERYVKELGREEVMSSILALINLAMHPYSPLSKTLLLPAFEPLGTTEEDMKTANLMRMSREVETLIFSPKGSLNSPEYVEQLTHLPRAYGQFLDEEHKRLLQSVFKKFHEIYKYVYDESLDHDLALLLRDTKVVVHDLKVLKKLLNDREFLQIVSERAPKEFLMELLQNLDRSDRFTRLLKYKALQRKDPALSKIADQINRERTAIILLARKLLIK